MIRFRSLLPLAAVACLLLPSCRVKTPEAVKERENWLLSLNDSIAKYEKERSEVEVQLQEAREKVGGIVGYFDYVNNPREVEGYYIFNGWKGKYPMQKTALVARVTEEERFELIATLTGGQFNEIGVMSAGETVSSDIVAHDQALNYRAGNLNTVCFYGAKADSVGEFIASHSTGEITVVYLNGKKTGSLILPSDEKQMVARTWELYAAQRHLHSLEKELPRLSGKIAACRKMLEKADSTADRR